MKSLYGRSDPVPTLYVKSTPQQWSISAIFARARATAPCLLVFEDLDTLVTPYLRSYFLNEVDGLESNDGILMIGSTNYRMLLRCFWRLIMMHIYLTSAWEFSSGKT